MGYEVEEALSDHVAYLENIAGDLQVSCNEQAIRITNLEKILAELDRYFTSGNDIPVERAVIHAKDYWKIRSRRLDILGDYHE
jgi:hypothetical protein